jgi:hypothetical protein
MVKCYNIQFLVSVLWVRNDRLGVKGVIRVRG